MINNFKIQKRIYIVLLALSGLSILAILLMFALASKIMPLGSDRAIEGFLGVRGLITSGGATNTCDLWIYASVVTLLFASFIMFAVGLIFSRVSMRRDLIIFLSLSLFFYAFTRVQFVSNLLILHTDHEGIHFFFIYMQAIMSLSFVMFLRQLQDGLLAFETAKWWLSGFFYAIILLVPIVSIFAFIFHIELSRMSIAMQLLLIVLLIRIFIFAFAESAKLKARNGSFAVIIVYLVVAIIDLIIYINFGKPSVLVPITAYMAFGLAFALWLFILREIYIGIEETNDVKEQLMKSRVQLMISQISPHFVYNALNSINILIKQDPDQAQKMIGNFSKYLRKNMNAMSEKPALINFDDELEHVKAYVEIEKVRFPKIQVQYEIDETNFRLPMLSVEPLVENAIKHGVARKREGGQVIIRAYKSSRFIIIEVRDNGVGFDMEKVLTQNSESLGIKNVMYRVDKIAGGEVTIVSEEGKGTTATIRLPIEKVRGTKE